MPRILNVIANALRALARAFAECGFMSPFGPWWIRLDAHRPDREAEDQ